MKILTSLAAVVGGLAFASGPVSAGNDNGPPPGLELDDVLVCDGVETNIHAGEGRSGWYNGEKWTLVSVQTDFEGETVFEKQYGGGPRGETVECTGSFGPYELVLVLVAVQ